MGSQLTKTVREMEGDRVSVEKINRAGTGIVTASYYILYAVVLLLKFTSKILYEHTLQKMSKDPEF